MSNFQGWGGGVPKILLLLTLAVAGCSSHNVDGPAADVAAPVPVVQTIAVGRGTIEQTLPTTGTLTAMHDMEAAISAASPGMVESIPVRVGQPVTANQVVATLSARALVGQVQQAAASVGQYEVQAEQAEVAALQQEAQGEAGIEEASSDVAEARATLASDQATLEGDLASQRSAQRSLDRQQELLKDGLVAGKDVEAAELAVETAQSQVDAQKQVIAAQVETINGQIDDLHAAQTARLQDAVKRKDVAIARQQVTSARGALATAQAQLALCTLRSPLDGFVTDIGANVGETVDTSTKLVTVANLDALQLEIAIPAEDAALVHAGEPVDFSIDTLPDRRFQAVIRLVSTQVDTTGAVSAYTTVPNTDHLLRDDQLAQVSVIVRRKDNVLILPASAILTDPASGAKSVDVVGSDDVVRSQSVRLGITSGSDVEVVGGLDAGDRVAVAGQYELPDGTKVSVSSAP